MLPRPKTTNVDHMKSNIAVDFVFSDEDMTALKNVMPVFGKKR